MTDYSTKILTREDVDLGLRILRGEIQLGTLPPEYVPEMEALASRVAKEYPNWMNPDAPTQTKGEIISGAVINIYNTSGGGGGGGIAGDTRPDMSQASDEELDRFVRENYGYMAGYLQHPEIGPILRQAAREDWDQNRLAGALSETTYWKTTAATARQWDALQQTDPAEAARQLGDKKTDIGTYATSLGLNLNDSQITQIANDSIRLGWDKADITRALLTSGGDQLAGLKTGDFGATVKSIQQLSKSYMLPMTDAAAQQYAQQMLLGEVTEDGLRAMFSEQAKGRFTGLADIIDKGITPEQFFQPYQQDVARLLEISPDQVDFMTDSRFAPIVETVGTDGLRRPMTMSETQQYVRGLADWRTTQQAGQQAANLAEFISAKFGRVA